MRKKGKLVVLDFDDTLFFTQGSVTKATKELLNRTDLSKAQVRKLPKKTKSAVYELAYSKYKHHSKPNMKLVKFLEKSRKDWKIIVLTARGRTLHADTLSLIKKHKIRISGFYSRADIAGADEVWKLGRVKAYAKRYTEVELYEDKRENIEYIKQRIGSYNIKFYLVTKRAIRRYL